MTLDEAITYFGNAYKMCKAMNKDSQLGYKFKQLGYIPVTYQLILQEVTNNALIARTIDGKPKYN